ncbi:MAG: hypothetical protein JWM36_2183 [Hyphomicrobiales bacterium]|nr:hypothetical protein [Hyphomicrobiales bacterium]
MMCVTVDRIYASSRPAVEKIAGIYMQGQP